MLAVDLGRGMITSAKGFLNSRDGSRKRTGARRTRSFFEMGMVAGFYVMGRLRASGGYVVWRCKIERFEKCEMEGLKG